MFDHIRSLAGVVADAIRNDSIGFTESLEKIISKALINTARGRATTLRVGLAHRCIWILVLDLLADGWRTDNNTYKDVTQRFDADFGVADLLALGMGSARQDGGAWWWVVDGDDQATPKRDGTLVTAVHVVTMEEATIVEFERDHRSKQLGKAKIVEIVLMREDISVRARVHASRLVYIPGAPVTVDSKTNKRGYDLSYMQLYWPIIEAMEQGYNSNGDLLSRLSMPWLSMPQGKEVFAGDQANYEPAPQDPSTLVRLGSKIKDRMELLKTGMKRSALLVTIGDDKISWTGPNAVGVRDLMTIQAERLSSVEGIPLSKFFGQAPGGLSTDDAAGQRSYDAVKSRNQKMVATPALLRLYDIALGKDPTRKIVWPDSVTPTALERAQTSLTLAQRDQALFAMTAVTADEVRSRFKNGEEVEHFELEANEPIMDENISMESLLADAIAEVGQSTQEQITDAPAQA